MMDRTKKGNMIKLFSPKSVCLIGASHKKSSVGYGILKNLIKGGVFDSKYNTPFKGKIFAVNPNVDKILGKKCYTSVLDVINQLTLQ